MRILFTFIGGSGHFRPLIPVARAARAAGHTVAFAGGGRRGPEITAAGFTAFATSEPRGHTEATAAAATAAVRSTVEVSDPEEDIRHLAEGFARRGARRHAAAVLELARTWKPDILVRDEVDFGTAVAAESLGLPCASVLVLAAGGFLRKDVVAEPLHELRSEYGLPYDPDLAVLDRDLVLSPFPPSFRDPRFPLPAHTFSFRPTAARPPEATPGTPGTPGTPTVYVTLGTVHAGTDLFSRIAAGLRELPVNVLMTVSDHIDPAVLGPLPGHIRVERFVPQEQLLPQCALVVSHGGSGSLMGALAHGLPSVLFPHGADQPYNARRCTELGAARTLDPVTATPEDIHSAVSTVLADSGYRSAAERIRDEMNALPGAAETVPALEALALSR
ncbi:glycosyltransferase [Streptomyces sp. NBC_01766]|uniref:glycosyltransferase n=1 Tax=Streptomyces sp. NBC_01766 TaxID=2975936 RepID=UPI002DDAE1AA|nr:glycosyltransferase [Streptomyces sp. NBC_01766]WSC20194.1 glycosyltransferase [Streptomyces sp. NBC_01766]